MALSVTSENGFALSWDKRTSTSRGGQCYTCCKCWNWSGWRLTSAPIKTPRMMIYTLGGGRSRPHVKRTGRDAKMYIFSEIAQIWVSGGRNCQELSDYFLPWMQLWVRVNWFTVDVWLKTLSAQHQGHNQLKGVRKIPSAHDLVPKKASPVTLRSLTRAER